MKNLLLLVLLLCGFAACQLDSPAPGIEEIEKNFIKPPADAGPEVWWHWINGNISSEGITRDLEALKDKGYRGVTAFSIGHRIFGHHPEGPIRYMSPEWYDLFHHALSESDRLGLKLMFHNCDGWATSGGPWVQPRDAMKELVYSEEYLTGPVSYKEPLREPCKTMDFYKDIAIMAHPVKEHNVTFMIQQNAVPDASMESKNLGYLFDDNPTTWAELSGVNAPGEKSVLLTFPEEATVSKLLFYHTSVWGETQAVRCELFGRDVNGQFRSLIEFNHQQPYSLIDFEETRAREFKLVFHSFNRWENYVLQQLMKIQELQLLPPGTEPRLPLISDWENKAGYNNVRVNGDYLPQGPVDPVRITPPRKVIDLTDRFSDGKLEWEVPSGVWRVVRLGYTVTGKPNTVATDEGRGLECDKLSAESVESFFRGLPQEIFTQNEALLGEPLHAMLIDSWEAANQNWTRDFPSEFEKRRGYSLQPWLLVLTGSVVESVEASERFLWDFRRTIGDLIKENYYGKMTELSNQYGISLQAEAAHVALQFMVDAINYHSKVDIPMNEFWVYPDRIGYNIRPGFTDAASAAHIYDKKIVACESFTCSEGNWRHSPFWLKPAADKVFTMGVNRITFDTYTHQPDERAPGWNLSPWGTAHNRKLTWWEYERPWIEYLSRCQYLLQMGDHVADFLVFTGESVPSFLSVQAGNDNGLVPPGYAFDGCNKETLLERIRVKDGKLVLPHGPSYRAVIIPDMDRMTPELAKGIEELLRKGVTVFGERPAGSPSLVGYPECDKKVNEIAERIWKNPDKILTGIYPYGKGRMVNGLDMHELTGLLDLEPDFEYRPSSGQANLEYIHKRIGDMEVYFISNQDFAHVTASCIFRVSGKRPELWLPDAGTIDREIPFGEKEGRTEVSLDLDPYGSAFIVFQGTTDGPDVTVPESRQEIKASFTINGPWEVGFPDGMGAPESTRINQLASWTDHGNESIRYYSGTAVYKNSFRLPEDLAEAPSLRLNLGMVKEIARVYINGKEAGILWKPPFELDVTSYIVAGENSLEVHVVNTWTNRLIGDLSLPEEERYTWTNCCPPLSVDSPLMESGLMGPVILTGSSP